MSASELVSPVDHARERSRWPLGRNDADRLLERAAEARGESLWTDARRRLMSNRAAAWCLRFLAAFAVVSLAAPLLPLTSPVALHLQSEPRAPVAPWIELGDHGFARDYWRLSAIDAGLVDVRERAFGDWETGHWLGTDAKGRDLLIPLFTVSRAHASLPG